MKSLKFMIVAVVATMISSSANAQMVAARPAPSHTTLVGEIANAGNVKVTLQQIGEKEIFGTTIAKNGKFKIKGKRTLPFPFKLTVGNKSMEIVLSSGTVKIKGEMDDLQNATVEGSSSHKEYMVLLKSLDKCKTEMEKEVAMEEFMREYTHSWVSVYLLGVFHERYPESTQKMRMLMNHVKHYEHAGAYKKIEKAVAAVELSEE